MEWRLKCTFKCTFHVWKLQQFIHSNLGNSFPSSNLMHWKKKNEFLLSHFFWIHYGISFFFRLWYSLSQRQKVFILLNLITSDYKIETKISYFFQCWVHINHSHFIDLWSLPLHHYIMIIIVFDVVILT